MKKLAIRSRMGSYIYYTTTLTFKEIAEHIKLAEEIHESKDLSEMIQRGITSNSKDIANYLLNQNERLFNSLVIAVYNGTPSWVPIELNDETLESGKIGILEFTGNETFFALDGQHRAEGIKLALTNKDNDLSNDEVQILLIGYHDTDEGRESARRLFSTLNRRGKKVNDKYIIALDEDDLTAITTRGFVSSKIQLSKLINSQTVLVSESKAMPAKDKRNFTNIRILNEVHNHLLYHFLSLGKDKKVTKKIVEEFKKYRPDEDLVNSFEKECVSFWEAILNHFGVLSDFVEKQEITKSSYGQSNLLFRSVGIIGFSRAVFDVSFEKGLSFVDCIKLVEEKLLDMNIFPWEGYLYRVDENSEAKMLITGTANPFPYLFFKYVMLKGELNDKDMKKMVTQYKRNSLSYNDKTEDEIREAFQRVIH